MPYEPTINRLWTGRKFGIEMEMMTTRRTQTGRTQLRASELSDALMAVCHSTVTGDGSHYRSRSQGQSWEIMYDGSAGWEVASPALTLDDDGHSAELKRGADAIRALRPTITNACGLHVHVDCHDLDWRELQKVIALFLRYEPFFFEMLPASRKANTYCRPARSAFWEMANTPDYQTRWSLFERVLEASTNRQFEAAIRAVSKYTSLNVVGWLTHGRIEFRLHSGTVTYKKIRNWVILLLALVNRVKAEDAPRLSKKINQPKAATGFSTEYVLRMIGLGPSRWNRANGVYEEIKTWVDRRRERFAGTGRNA